MMVEKVIKGRLTRWGDGLGVRISKRDAMRLHLHEGAPVTMRVERARGTIDLSVLPTLFGEGTEGREHDRILGAGRGRDLKKRATSPSGGVRGDVHSTLNGNRRRSAR